MEIDCDDGNMCTDDECDDGNCVHTKKDCGCTDDGYYYDEDEDGKNMCLYCGCSSTQGGCQTWGVDCDDHDPTTIDMCEPNSGCIHRRHECVDDGDLRTEEMLDPKTGQCLHILIPCDDGLICTVDVLNIDGTCSHYRRDECFGTNMCMIYGCDEDMGGCISPQRVDCNDNNPCTTDSCDSLTGECVYANTPKPSNLVDTPCTRYECHVERGGWVAVDVECRDKDACTRDYCDHSTGECIHVQRNECTATLPCHEASCDGETGDCVETIVDMGDGDVCTLDLCVEVQYPPGWEIQHVPKCVQDTSNRCILATFCHNGECHNVPRNCDDLNPCTSDRCNPGTGCVYEKVACDDHDVCTLDYCSKNEGGCVYVKMDCDDHDPRTIDTCDQSMHGGLAGPCDRCMPP
jgi:hypothetical protein